MGYTIRFRFEGSRTKGTAVQIYTGMGGYMFLEIELKNYLKPCIYLIQILHFTYPQQGRRLKCLIAQSTLVLLLGSMLETNVSLLSLTCRRHKTAYLATMFFIDVYVHVEDMQLEIAMRGVPFATIGALFGNFYGFACVHNFLVFMQAVQGTQHFATHITDDLFGGIVIFKMSGQTFFTGISEIKIKA